MLFTGYLIYPAQLEQKVNLDAMPPEVIGLICGHLNHQIGTHGFVNEADFPIVMKNVSRLASVNKKLYETVHSIVATNLLIESLANRFAMAPLDVATKIKTKGGQAWLKKYVHDSGDYELFKVVQQIFAICREISEQVTPYGVSIGDGQEACPGVNPYYYQTRQGFMLIIDTYPDRLCTPWGEAQLFGGGSCRGGLGFDIISQELLKRITAHFEEILDDMYGFKYYEQKKEIIPEITNQRSFKDCFQEISKDAMEEKKGQQILIKSSFCGVKSFYAIKAIGNQQLPEPELLDQQEYRSYEAMNAIWKIMDNQFHGRSEEFEEESLFNADEKSERIYPALYQVVPNVHLATMHQAAEQYAQLAARVANQPIFTGKGCINRSAKVLPCQNLYDVRIVEVLTKNANNLLPKENHWHLHSFGSSNNQLYINNESLENGLALWGYKDNQPCSVGILQAKYQEILDKLQVGWQQAQLIDNQDILYTQSEETWYLFCKSENLQEEDYLINILASKCTLDKKITCHDSWRNDKKHEKNEMYLWIRKDAFHQVKDILGLELSLKTSMNNDC